MNTELDALAHQTHLGERALLGGTSCTTETAVVEKPAEEEDGHYGHHHSHAHRVSQQLSTPRTISRRVTERVPRGR